MGAALRVNVLVRGRGGGESACTPDSVRDLAVRRRPSISAGDCPPAPAAYPGSDGRDHPPPARPCSGWGLPSHPGRPGCWCALTAPFHPYLCGGHTSAGRPGRHRRSALCCTFLRVTPTGRYPASCPVESGRSSDGSPPRRAGPHAATRPTRHRSHSITRRRRRPPAPIPPPAWRPARPARRAGADGGGRADATRSPVPSRGRARRCRSALRRGSMRTAGAW
jgi:hypothetical protein